MQPKIPEIKLETTCANGAIIYFKSKMFLSLINIVQVFIFMSITNFHVVDILTLFFYYLKDINILGIYLNNIINQLISQKGKSITIFCK